MKHGEYDRHNGVWWYRLEDEEKLRVELEVSFGRVCKEHSGVEDETRQAWGYFTYRVRDGYYRSCDPLWIWEKEMGFGRPLGTQHD